MECERAAGLSGVRVRAEARRGLRYKLFLVDATGCVLGLIDGEGVPNDVAVEGVIGVGVPF